MHVVIAMVWYGVAEIVHTCTGTEYSVRKCRIRSAGSTCFFQGYLAYKEAERERKKKRGRFLPSTSAQVEVNDLISHPLLFCFPLASSVTEFIMDLGSPHRSNRRRWFDSSYLIFIWFRRDSTGWIPSTWQSLPWDKWVGSFLTASEGLVRWKSLFARLLRPGQWKQSWK